MAGLPKLVIVTPNPPGLTLTAQGGHEATSQNLGKLNKGEIYMAVQEYTGYYQLKPYKTPFPLPIPATQEVWADVRFLPEYVEEPPDEPEPEPDEDISLVDLLYIACKAVVDYIEGMTYERIRAFRNHPPVSLPRGEHGGVRLWRTR